MCKNYVIKETKETKDQWLQALAEGFLPTSKKESRKKRRKEGSRKDREKRTNHKYVYI